MDSLAQAAQRLYGQEVVQIDGHARFIEGWVEVLRISMLARQIASHPSDISEGSSGSAAASRSASLMSLYFRENGTWNRYSRHAEQSPLAQPDPLPALGRRILLLSGRHCQEVPYDPSIYFSDENSMAVRSFTHGYDLFHPHRHILWHHYRHEAAPRHWMDNTEEAQHPARSAFLVAARMAQRVAQHQQLFGQADYGIAVRHGFGNQRSLADFETFADFTILGAQLMLTRWRTAPPVP